MPAPQFDAPSPPAKGEHLDVSDLIESDSIRFNPSDVWDKWGFDDGDLLYGVLDAWLYSRRWVPLGEIGTAYPYVTGHLLLFAVYERFVATAFDVFGERPKVEYVNTMHNPVRAMDDLDADDAGEDGDDRDHPEPDAVIVPIEQIFELADELFPPRPRGWLCMFNVVFSSLFTQAAAVMITESLASRYTDGQLQMAAELIAGLSTVRDDSMLAALQRCDPDASLFDTLMTIPTVKRALDAAVALGC